MASPQRRTVRSPQRNKKPQLEVTTELPSETISPRAYRPMTRKNATGLNSPTRTSKTPQWVIGEFTPPTDEIISSSTESHIPDTLRSPDRTNHKPEVIDDIESSTQSDVEHTDNTTMQNNNAKLSRAPTRPLLEEPVSSSADNAAVAATNSYVTLSLSSENSQPLITSLVSRDSSLKLEYFVDDIDEVDDE